MTDYQREMLIKFNGAYSCNINGYKVIYRNGVIIWKE